MYWLGVRDSTNFIEERERERAARLGTASSVQYYVMYLDDGHEGSEEEKCKTHVLLVGSIGRRPLLCCQWDGVVSDPYNLLLSGR